jgi:hypothetical protein
MKERYFVGTISSYLPEMENVYWFAKKSDAMAEAQHRKIVFPSEAKQVVVCKVLNLQTVESKTTKGEA